MADLIVIEAHEHPGGLQGFPSVDYTLIIGLSNYRASANAAIELLERRGFSPRWARRALHEARDRGRVSVDPLQPTFK